MRGCSEWQSPVMAAGAHWSGVLLGESFTIELQYDAATYEKSIVEVKLRRSAVTGLTESDEPTWSWKVESKHGEGKAKVVTAARARAGPSHRRS